MVQIHTTFCFSLVDKLTNCESETKISFFFSPKYVTFDLLSCVIPCVAKLLFLPCLKYVCKKVCLGVRNAMSIYLYINQSLSLCCDVDPHRVKIDGFLYLNYMQIRKMQAKSSSTITTLYSQLSNKRVGQNKRVSKLWCCLPIKCSQIKMSRVDFFLEKNKRECLFIRELRVLKYHS